MRKWGEKDRAAIVKRGVLAQLIPEVEVAVLRINTDEFLEQSHALRLLFSWVFISHRK